MLKPGDLRHGSGDFDDRIVIYEMVDGRDASLGVTRTPVERWKDWAAFVPLSGDELKQGVRELGESWAAFTINWHRSLIPLEDWVVERTLTGEKYEIRAVQQIDRKVTLIHGRLVR